MYPLEHGLSHNQMLCPFKNEQRIEKSCHSDTFNTTSLVCIERKHLNNDKIRVMVVEMQYLCMFSKKWHFTEIECDRYLQIAVCKKADTAISHPSNKKAWTPLAECHAFRIPTILTNTNQNRSIGTIPLCIPNSSTAK